MAAYFALLRRNYRSNREGILRYGRRGCSKFCVTVSELTRFACWPLIFNRASAQSNHRLKFKEVDFTGPGISPADLQNEWSVGTGLDSSFAPDASIFRKHSIHQRKAA